MKQLKLIGIVILIQVFLYSCEKNYDLFVPDNNSLDTTWTNPVSPNQNFSKLLDELGEKPVSETISDIGIGGTINFPGGIQVQIPEKSCKDADGLVPSGSAKVEILFLNTRGQFIRNNKPTTSDGNPLETSAEVLVRIIHDGEELSLVQGKYIIVSYPQSSTSNSLTTYYPEPGGTGNTYLNWTAATDGSYAIAFAKPDSLSPGRMITGYDIKIRQLRWVNCGMLTDTLNRSAVTATLPDICTNANTKVFVVFTDIKSVVQMQDNVSSKIFFAPHIPVSKSVRFISISAVNSDYYLGVVDANTVANNNYSIKPQKKTLSEIVEFLKSL